MLTWTYIVHKSPRMKKRRDIAMNNETSFKIKSAMELLNTLFERDLADEEKYDPKVVELVEQHLGEASIHSKAGDRLAQALLELAKTRSEGDQ